MRKEHLEKMRKILSYNRIDNILNTGDKERGIFSLGFILDISEKSALVSTDLYKIICHNKADADEKEIFKMLVSHIEKEDLELFNKNIETVLLGKSSNANVNITIKYDDKYKKTDLKLCAIILNNHKLNVLGIFMENMTVIGSQNNYYLENAPHELTHAELVNKLIIEGASDYIFQYDVKNDYCLFSPHAVDVLPIDIPSFSNVMETSLSFIVPEDREHYIETITPFMTGKSQYHKAEYRVTTRYGEIMWVSCRGKGIHDKDGNPIMIAGSLVDITEIKKYQQHIELMANVDQLTGLFNRYRFYTDMNHNKSTSGAVLFIDIDDFKVYNDVFGHSFGNEVLIKVARKLEGNFNKAEGIYRLGGDEFVIHCPSIDRITLDKKLSTLVANIREPIVINDKSVYITLSIGVAFYPEHGRNADEILNNADMAMYTAKKSGKDSIKIYIDSSHEEISRRFMLETELRRAVEENFQDFSLHYQPIVDASSGKWKGAEALIRWKSPTFGNVPANELIDILEYMGLMVKVGRWILNTAVKECSAWHKAGLKDKFIHVNLSMVQIDNPNLQEDIIQTLKNFCLPPQLLYLELTESILMKNIENTTNFCKAMQNMKVRISLDDFGTGYSSLSYLRQLPLDEIKIDKSFLMNFESDDYNKAIVLSLCDLAHTIKLSLCVEGVEEDIHWKILKDMNVDTLQGYLFAKPMTSKEFREKLL